MNTEISRTPVSNEPGVFIVQRVSGPNFEILKETVLNSGEIQDVNDELTTVETIVITRKITKTQF